MYQFLLASHNIMRWVVVVLAIYALVRIFMGLFGKREFTETDRKSLSFYAIGMDIQLVLGLLLYFIFSPITTAAFSDFGAAMSNSAIRFFAVEHIMLMVVAVVLAHVEGGDRLGHAAGRGLDDALWRREAGDHRAVGVGVGVDLQHPGVRR